MNVGYKRGRHHCRQSSTRREAPSGSKSVAFVGGLTFARNIELTTRGRSVRIKMRAAFAVAITTEREAWGVFSRTSHYVLAAQTVNTFLNSSAPTTLIASMITADAGDGNQVSDTLAVVSAA